MLVAYFYSSLAKNCSIFIKRILLPFTTIFTVNRALHENKPVKQLIVSNIRCTNQQKDQFVIWMAKAHQGTAFLKLLFPSYFISAPSSRTVNVCCQRCNERGSYSDEGGNESRTIGAENPIRLKRCLNSIQNCLYENLLPFWCPSQNLLAILTQ